MRGDLRLLLLTAMTTAVVLTAGTAAGSPGTLTVPATANIFRAAGNPAAPDGTGGEGTAPPAYQLRGHGYRFVTFSSVSGLVNPGIDPENGPQGRTGFSTDLTGTGGISGAAIANRAMFLVGVFVGAAPPAVAPPTGTRTLAPRLGQIFYIGSGKSAGNRARLAAFTVPAGATQLYLGIADGFGFNGVPGSYGDNTGSFSAQVQPVKPTPTQSATRHVMCQRAYLLRRVLPHLETEAEVLDRQITDLQAEEARVGATPQVDAAIKLDTQLAAAHREVAAKRLSAAERLAVAYAC